MSRRRSGHRGSALALVGSVALLLALTSPALAGGKRSVHVTKIDGAGNAIAGATFELFVDAAPKGGGPPKGAEDTTSAGKCTTDATGQCDITGLTPGDYWLSETGPPAGFTPAPDSQVKIEKGKPNPSVVVSDDKTPKSIRVNNPIGDASVGDGTHITQFGSSVAIGPNGQVLVAFNDTVGLTLASSLTGFATSTDGGATFADHGNAPVPAGTIDVGDPAVLYDVVGNRFFLLSTLCEPPTGATCPLVSRISDDGVHWFDPIAVDPTVASGDIGHSPSLATDAAAGSPFAGNVYVAWTRSNGGTSEVLLSRSRDHGLSWLQPVPVGSSGHVDDPDVTVAPNGSVYLTWTSFQTGTVEENRIFVSRSTDGGQTFSPPVQVGGPFDPSGHAGICDGQARTVLNGNIRSRDPSDIVVNPLDPNKIYVAFGSHGEGADEADVFFSRSVDGGMTWTPPEPILPTAKDQFFPTIEITDGGKVGVFFFDRGYHAPLIDLSGVVFNGAGTEVKAGRLTPRSFHVPMLDPSFDSFLSDCGGFAPPAAQADGPSFMVVWNDARDKGPVGDNGVNPSVYAARLSVR